MRTLAAIAVLACLGVATAQAQQLGAYASLTYDYQTNVAQADAQTYVDYYTAYYYTATVLLDLEVTPVSGGSSNTACYTYGMGDNAPAEASCSPTIPGDNNLNLYGYHDLYVEYTEYQLNPYSCYYCDEYDDIYGYSLLGVYGDEFPYDVSWFAPMEDEPVTYTEILDASENLNLTTNGCQFPTDETSAFYWWGTNDPDLAGFDPSLQGSADYGGRVVSEEVTPYQTGDTCWFSGSQFLPDDAPENGTYNGSWWVGGLYDSDIGGAYLGPFSNGYGLDYVGYKRTQEVNYYSDQAASGRYQNSVPANQCGLIKIQRMYIDGCGGYSQYYGLWHSLQYIIKAGALEIRRDTATSGSKSVP
ncbi:MAG TPA: hypothetical protein VMW54_01185 [Terriglobia bacterium]|nr:hypothetical protein [Terriglobia bacterium]